MAWCTLYTRLTRVSLRSFNVSMTTARSTIFKVLHIVSRGNVEMGIAAKRRRRSVAGVSRSSLMPKVSGSRDGIGQTEKIERSQSQRGGLPLRI
jgi:hypothetical protein